MKQGGNNYAFIDSQNLNRGIESLHWKLDFRRFRVYLREKYSVTTAYLFIGYVPKNKNLYSALQKAGYILIFKPTIPDGDGNVKVNIDADLVLQVMLDYDKYDKAVIITSDGDFYSLVAHLQRTNKLAMVLSPHINTCSRLLRKAAGLRIYFMDNLRQKLEFKRK